MTEENTEFDFQKALKGIQEGKPFTGKGGVLTSLIKNLAEAALEGELESHLGQEVSANRRNGKSKKTIKSLDGKFELETPRDRAGTFSPQIVKKHQTTLSDEIERKIIALYGLGMSYNDRECSEFCVTVSVPGSASAPAEVKVRSENGPSISHVGGVDFCWSGVPGTIFSICK
ncbi:MAG: transposase [Desulfobacter sp.]|nr:transposase [Desulfobacter sp.]